MAQIACWFQKGLGFCLLLKILPVILLLTGAVVSLGMYVALMLYTPEEFSMGLNFGVIMREDGGPATLLRFLVATPFKEEFFFRLIPLSCIILILRFLCIETSRAGVFTVITTILYTSYLFGDVHGPGHVLVQGVLGVVLAVVFLKASQYGERLAYGLGASTVVHGAWNGAIMTKVMVLS